MQTHRSMERTKDFSVNGYSLRMTARGRISVVTFFGHWLNELDAPYTNRFLAARLQQLDSLLVAVLLLRSTEIGGSNAFACFLPIHRSEESEFLHSRCEDQFERP